MKNTQTTFSFNQKTLNALEELKEKLGASSKAEVLRRAVALLYLANEMDEDQKGITLQNQKGQTREITLF